MISLRCDAMSYQNGRSQLRADQRGDLESAQTLRAADQREISAGHAIQKRVDLVRKRVTFFDFDGFRADVEPSRAWRGLVENLRAALVIIDRDIGIGLKKANLALAFERNPARGHIGNTTIGEIDPRIGDIRFIGQDRDPDRLDPFDRGTDQTRDHVDIVNHQVQDHVDISAALNEWRQPVALDKLGLTNYSFETANRRIEALEMTDLKNDVFCLRQLYELACLGDIRRKRFFN